MNGHLLIIWTIRLAPAAGVATLLMWLLGYRPRSLRPTWTLGCLSFAAHAVAAMQFEYHWSHSAALASTARQTRELLGWEFGEGLWFSWLFLMLWCSDVLWAWIAPNAWEDRPPGLSRFLYAYMVFIAFNGAIVFESGVTRPVGIAACVLLMATLVHRIRRRGRQTIVRGVLPDETED